jgi:hypothetical protein
MFYLAVLLILLGVLIFIYSISVEKLTPGSSHGVGTRPSAPGTYYRAETESPSAQPKRNIYDEMSEAELNDYDRYSGEQASDSDIFEDKLTAASVARDQKETAMPQVAPAVKAPPFQEFHSAETAADDNGSNAVLFEDSSGAFDYSVLPLKGTAAPAALAKIKRIGEGRLTPEKNGISFHMKNRLYRFDYHRIEGLNFGDDFLAVNSGGKTPVRFFILNSGSSEAVEQINSDYNSLRPDSIRH